MAPRREIPAAWKKLLDRRGLPSVRRLADLAGLSQPATNSLVYGDGKRPSEDTIAKVATALDVPLADIYQLAGAPAPQAVVWVPPAEANRMTTKQRQAIEDTIRAMVGPD